MLLSCPNCGTVTEIPDVLIPSARLTATCSGCGAKIGGTVPSRLNEARPGRGRADGRQMRDGRHKSGGESGPPERPEPSKAADRAGEPEAESRETSAEKGKPTAEAGRPAAEARDSAPNVKAGHPTLGSVSKGLDPERLAGLVASDMLLYNRDKIQKNVADGRLLSSMATEIVEAWEFYKKRVGSHTALGTSYFRDALNNVLSGGDPII